MPRQTAPMVLEIISLAEEREILGQRLFEAFSAAIPESADLWLGIAATEAKHVRLIRDLKEYANQNRVQMRTDSKVDTRQLQHAISHIKLYVEDVKQHGVSARRAAVIAMEVEDGYLESHLDEAFEADNESVQKILLRVKDNTEGHREQMQALLFLKDEFRLLVERGLVSAAQLDVARTIALRDTVSMESVLVARFGVAKQVVLESLAKCFRMPTYELKLPIEVPQEIVDALRPKYDMLKAKLMMPVAVEGDKVVVALAHPRNTQLRDDVRYLIGQKNVEFRIAIVEDVLAAIDDVFQAAPQEDRPSSTLLLKELEAEAPLTTEEDESEVGEDDNTVVRLVNTVIEEAHAQGASDIHVEPTPGRSIVIRYRVDGTMRKAMECPRHLRNAMVSRIKIMAGLDIAERRKPQSGKILFKRWGRLDIELRVEVYPTAGGAEDAVLRLLSTGKPRPLTDLGLSDLNLAALRRVLVQPYGLFLCVGPTGSGKTSTLHAALGLINKDDVKILTVEDPVEITQPGLRQVQISRKAGLSFAEALRSFLRADPDIIMIGEMRDIETASIAIEASLTGHLVVSTLHTNSAPETVTRLLDMGLDPYAFSDALLAILAQRLVRTLCVSCKETLADHGALLTDLRKEYGHDALFDTCLQRSPPDLRVPRQGGCPTCGASGYKGRAGIHELLIVDDESRRLIVSKASAARIRDAAVAAGMRSLKQAGIEKILRGQTTIFEVNAVCSR